MSGKWTITVEGGPAFGVNAQAALKAAAAERPPGPTREVFERLAAAFDSVDQFTSTADEPDESPAETEACEKCGHPIPDHEWTPRSDGDQWWCSECDCILTAGGGS